MPKSSYYCILQYNNDCAKKKCVKIVKSPAVKIDSLAGKKGQ